MARFADLTDAEGASSTLTSYLTKFPAYKNNQALSAVLAEFIKERNYSGTAAYFEEVSHRNSNVIKLSSRDKI